MMLFALFVYGTLKTGLKNHARYCGTAARSVPARVWGRLYRSPRMNPILMTDASLILAQASISMDEDLNQQQRHRHCPFACPKGEWDLVKGEVHFFADPTSELPPIDALEAFHAQGSVHTYERVLMPVLTPNGAIAAWLYRREPQSDSIRMYRADWQLR